MIPMLRLLLVDDEQRVLDGYGRTLRLIRPKWEVWTVTSGDEALRVLPHARFDAIVTDLAMLGINGHQVLQWVKREQPHIVRILLSGYIDANALVESHRVAELHACKPYPVKRLAEDVEALLAHRAAGRRVSARSSAVTRGPSA